jgi:hypothetical protein
VVLKSLHPGREAVPWMYLEQVVGVEEEADRW